MPAISATNPILDQPPTFPSDEAPEPSPFERIERDIRALERQKMSRVYLQSSKREHPSTCSAVGSPEKHLPPVPRAQDFWDDEQQRSGAGTKVPEPRYSIGPEKIWSIGSGELDDAQDGHVEKSIAKAMSKEEPNNRSRKASHTLGFFREGLPDEKTKRKGAKGATQAQPEPNAERPGRTGTSSDVISEDPVESLKPQVPPVRSPPKREVPPVTSRRPTPPPEPTTQSDQATDITSPTRDTKPQATPAALHPPSPAPSNDEPTSRAGNQSPTDRPQSPASSKGRAQHDEGDESGEEKISSAFFLPHQDPERPMGEERSTPDDLQPVTGHVKLRGQERSTWLVKAGEPEPEDHTPPPTPPSSQSGHPGRRSSFVSNRDTAKVCEEIVVVDEPEKTLPSSEKAVSHPTLLYHENYQIQEGDQRPAKQPLEAIELIPYNHQVGGHTPLWRFSKRAVCKKLNNRENEFYETVEHFHRDLLPFLPRYVVFRHSILYRDPFCTPERGGGCLNALILSW